MAPRRPNSRHLSDQGRLAGREVNYEASQQVADDLTNCLAGERERETRRSTGRTTGEMLRWNVPLTAGEASADDEYFAHQQVARAVTLAAAS